MVLPKDDVDVTGRGHFEAKPRAVKQHPNDSRVGARWRAKSLPNLQITGFPLTAVQPSPFLRGFFFVARFACSTCSGAPLTSDSGAASCALPAAACA